MTTLMEETLGWRTEEELNTPSTPSSRDFPEGQWQGTIERVDVYEVFPGENREWMLRRGDKSLAESAMICDIKFSDIQPLAEGQEEPGNQPVFDKRIYIEFDGTVWNDPAMTKAADWQIRASRGRLQRLAHGLGLTEDGVPTEEFDELLRTGELAGQTLEFDVWHRNWESNGKTGTEVNVGKYRAAV